MSEQDPERNRLSGRIARTAKVGANLSGAGLTFATQSLFGGSKGDERIAKALAAALGKSKGPLMKVAQLMSTIPDFLPEEYANELSQLQAEAPAMGWPFVKRRMRSELGSGWQETFQSFEKKAAHAASLGQVHRGEIDGVGTVACKLQYPDMASAVESDLGQLKPLLGLFKRLDGSVDASDMFEEISDRLHEELDYKREAAHMRLYKHMLTDIDYVQTPEPVEEYCTDRLLTMTWVTGQRLDAFEDAPLEVRNNIARMLYKSWWTSMNKFAVIHGDPHLGNYQVTGNGEGINLLDFGCVRIFTPEFVEGTVELYRGLQADNKDQIYAAYEKLGFEGLNNDLYEIMNIWASFMYGPLLDDRVRKVTEGSTVGTYGRNEAFRVRQQLKEKGPIKVPKPFVFMDRAAIGVGAAYLRLGAELNFHEMFNEDIADFDVNVVAARQAEAMSVSGLDKL